jgi:hypothetical protein
VFRVGQTHNLTRPSIPEINHIDVYLNNSSRQWAHGPSAEVTGTHEQIWIGCRIIVARLEFEPTPQIQMILMLGREIE